MASIFGMMMQRNGLGLVGRSAMLTERSTRAGRTPKKNFRGMATSKMGNKNFYKGRGAPTYGRLTSKGRFILEKEKIPMYELPTTLSEELLNDNSTILLPYVWRKPAIKKTN